METPVGCTGHDVKSQKRSWQVICGRWLLKERDKDLNAVGAVGGRAC